jgi:hypothetical protein
MTCRGLAVGVGILLGVACSSSSKSGEAPTDSGSPSGHDSGHDSGPRSGRDAGGSSEGGSRDSATSPRDGAGGETAVPMSVCSDSSAKFVSSDPEGQWTDGDYFIRNDAWNSDAGPQTLHACSYRSWNVVANEPSTTDVKTYPDVQMDFQMGGASTGSGVPLDTFKKITSTFAETSPHVGIYEDAYDIFVNSTTLVGPGTTEIMIWVDNYEQVPAGTKVASSVSLSGRTYDVYFEADNGNGGHYIAFVADTSFTSGTLDLMAFFDYVIKKSWIPSTAPLNQICFGVEICETGGADATFQFTDFSIDAE